MKMTIEVDVDDDPFKAQCVINASKLGHAIKEIDSRLRSMAKYENKDSIDIVSMRSMLRDETEGFGDFLWHA